MERDTWSPQYVDNFEISSGVDGERVPGLLFSDFTVPWDVSLTVDVKFVGDLSDHSRAELLPLGSILGVLEDRPAQVPVRCCPCMRRQTDERCPLDLPHDDTLVAAALHRPRISGGSP